MSTCTEWPASLRNVPEIFVSIPNRLIRERGCGSIIFRDARLVRSESGVYDYATNKKLTETHR